MKQQLNGVKPVQMTELEAAFEKCEKAKKGERLLRSQQTFGGGGADEEDSCPPDLEAVELQQQQQQQQPQPQQVHQQPEPQQVHQAPPPPSVPQQQDPFAGLDPTSDLVRNLAIAIKVGKLIIPFGREGVDWNSTSNYPLLGMKII